MKGSKQFFSIIVPLAALLVTLTLIITQTSIDTKFAQAKANRKSTLVYNLIKGWNTVALPLETGLTYSDVCSQLQVTAVYKWQNGNENPYLAYNCRFPEIENAKIIPNLGYLFYMSEARDWEIKGAKVPVNFDLAGAGFYMFNFVQNEKKDLFADEVCKKFTPRKKLEAVEIYQMKNNGWDTHICSLPSVNNFKLNYGVGYLIQLKEMDKPAKTNRKLNLPTQ
ncbi:hypothetical protein IPM62_01455 [Candidatus Woesebacteria bacterium]|nr:MAG: hypothetical protein IPM62_01455 [Candidatus Woesebacteria bacterium]